MKLSASIKQSGSTLAELMVGLSISSVIAAAAITASVGLHKSFNAVDQFFATQMQHIQHRERILKELEE